LNQKLYILFIIITLPFTACGILDGGYVSGENNGPIIFDDLSQTEYEVKIAVSDMQPIHKAKIEADYYTSDMGKRAYYYFAVSYQNIETGANKTTPINQMYLTDLISNNDTIVTVNTYLMDLRFKENGSIFTHFHIILKYKK